MAMRVRILRNTVGFRNSLFRFLRLVEVILNIRMRHYRQAEHDYITEARVGKIKIDTEVAEYRRRKLSNDLVIQDLEIEKRKMALGYRIQREPQETRQPGEEKAAWDY